MQTRSGDTSPKTCAPGACPRGMSPNPSHVRRAARQNGHRLGLASRGALGCADPSLTGCTPVCPLSLALRRLRLLQRVPPAHSGHATLRAATPKSDCVSTSASLRSKLGLASARLGLYARSAFGVAARCLACGAAPPTEDRALGRPNSAWAEFLRRLPPSLHPCLGARVHRGFGLNGLAPSLFFCVAWRRFALPCSQKKATVPIRALRSLNPKSVVASRLAESAKFEILALSENQIQKRLGRGREAGKAARRRKRLGQFLAHSSSALFERKNDV